MILVKNKEYSVHAWQGKISEELLNLFAACLDEQNDVMTAEEFNFNVDEYEHDDYDNRILFVLYHKTDPVGFLACYKFNEVGAEEHLYIEKEHRKISNLKMMMTLFEHWAREIGCKEIAIGHPKDEHGWQTVTVREIKHGT